MLVVPRHGDAAHVMRLDGSVERSFRVEDLADEPDGAKRLVSGAVSPKGDFVYALAGDGAVHCFATASGKREQKLDTRAPDALRLCHHPKQNALATFAAVGGSSCGEREGGESGATGVWNSRFVAHLKTEPFFTCASPEIAVAHGVFVVNSSIRRVRRLADGSLGRTAASIPRNRVRRATPPWRTAASAPRRIEGSTRARRRTRARSLVGSSSASVASQGRASSRFPESDGRVIVPMGSFEEASRRARLNKAQQWIKKRSQHEKTAMVVGLCVFVLLTLKLVIDDHDSLFLMAEAVHFLGIGVLGYKLVLTKNCSGLSLRSQDLTAIFLGIRLYCSAMMEGDWHTLLDALTLAATLWICYAMRFTDLKRSYAKGLDTLPVSWVLGPCAVAALAAHPTTSHMFVNRFLWATCVYVEAVSVLPQLRMMQRAKVVERFTPPTTFSRSASRASSPARTGYCRSSTGSRTSPPPSGAACGPSWCCSARWCRHSYSRTSATTTCSPRRRGVGRQAARGRRLRITTRSVRRR